MASWIAYKGLDLPDSPTGDAGMYLKSDLQALADRVGPCNFTATANPLPGNDITQGYQVGSLWLNTAAGSWWACTNNSAGYANWLLLAPSLSQATVVATSALPANNYSNGSGGVGAMLTATDVGVLTVDGHSVALNETVLVTDEATDANNGLYVCTRAGASGTTYVLTRSAMMNLPSQFVGAIIPVGPVGTSYSNTLWQCQVTSAPTIGTTSIQFAQISPPLSLPINLPNADSPVFSVDTSGNLTLYGGAQTIWAADPGGPVMRLGQKANGEAVLGWNVDQNNSNAIDDPSLPAWKLSIEGGTDYDGLKLQNVQAGGMWSGATDVFTVLVNSYSGTATLSIVGALQSDYVYGSPHFYSDGYGNLTAVTVTADNVTATEDVSGDSGTFGYIQTGDGDYIGGGGSFGGSVSCTSLSASIEIYYPGSYDVIVDSSGTLYYSNGYPLANYESLFYSNSQPLADNEGNLYYSNGNPLADNSGYLHYYDNNVLTYNFGYGPALCYPGNENYVLADDCDGNFLYYPGGYGNGQYVLAGQGYLCWPSNYSGNTLADTTTLYSSRGLPLVDVAGNIYGAYIYAGYQDWPAGQFVSANTQPCDFGSVPPITTSGMDDSIAKAAIEALCAAFNITTA